MSRPMSADIVVIGSGAAGAVVAARCAEQGARVVLLEEGPHVGPTTYDAQVQPVIRDLYRDGGAVMAFGVPPMPVQVGRCVGGSAAINGGTCFRTLASHRCYGWHVTLC